MVFYVFRGVLLLYNLFFFSFYNHFKLPQNPKRSENKKTYLGKNVFISVIYPWEH